MREGIYENRSANVAGTAGGVVHNVGGIAVHPVQERRISWGAVFAGVVLALAVQLLLSVLGLGIGATAINPMQGTAGTPDAGNLGIGTAIWWLVSSLLSMFAGGYVAARLAGVWDRGDGVIHGLLAWAFTLLVTFYLLSTAVGAVIGGAFNVVGNAASVAGQGVAQVAPQVAEATGITPDQLQQRALDLLRPEGAAPRDPAAAQRDLVGALTTMATGNPQDAAQARQRAIGIISAQAGISQQQATQRLDQLQGQLQQFQAQAADTARQAAQTTANAVSSGAIWAAVGLLLGAAVSAWGGSVGTRREEEYAVGTTRSAAV